jgi:hypothetical protein
MKFSLSNLCFAPWADNMKICSDKQSGGSASIHNYMMKGYLQKYTKESENLIDRNLIMCKVGL